ncbi:unnamed protein product [Mesocestoides corti]|uniref:Uncharacterized protein n=1 Tax=Mesocestoides corti TaxID=53468 RepID=A0A0R3UDT0_MESCO|nr:unnamed protein product [Mesocestoides corti]
MPAQRKHATSAYDMTPHMDWTSAVFNDCIYMIGGVNVNDRPTSLVNIMKPFTRSIVKAPSMKQARLKAAAATKDTQILVFGGFCHQTALSSCERFDILANRQVSSCKSDDFYQMLFYDSEKYFASFY